MTALRIDPSELIPRPGARERILCAAPAQLPIRPIASPPPVIAAPKPREPSAEVRRSLDAIEVIEEEARAREQAAQRQLELADKSLALARKRLDVATKTLRAADDKLSMAGNMLSVAREIMRETRRSPVVASATANPKELIASVRTVALAHGLKVQELLGRGKARRVAHARMEAMQAVRRDFPAISAVRIAKLFGVHHTTVLHALGKRGQQ